MGYIHILCCSSKRVCGFSSRATHNLGFPLVSTGLLKRVNRRPELRPPRPRPLPLSLRTAERGVQTDPGRGRHSGGDPQGQVPQKEGRARHRTRYVVVVIHCCCPNKRNQRFHANFTPFIYTAKY